MSFRKGFFAILLFVVSFSIFSQDVESNKMSIGVNRYKLGKYIDCIYYMNLVIEEKNELYSEALFWKAKSQFKLGHFEDSKTTLELLFRKGSIVTAYYEDARFLYCKVFFKLKKYTDSVLLFNQFRRNESFTYYKDVTLFWLGESYLQLSDLAKAKEYYISYLKIKPKSKIATDRLAVINRMLSLLNTVDDKDLTVVEKAGWFSDYVIKEINEDKNREGIKSLSNFIDNFETRDEFFLWLEQHIIRSSIKEEKEPEVILPEIIEEPVEVEEVKEAEVKVDNTEVSDTINDEEKLNDLENKILEELEMKILDALGDES